MEVTSAIFPEGGVLALAEAWRMKLPLSELLQHLLWAS